MTLSLLNWPNKALATVCEPVPSTWFNGAENSTFTTTLVEMANLCHRERGLALAANQVGILRRFIVIPPHRELSGQCIIDDEKKSFQPTVMINPIYSAAPDFNTCKAEEGCLSYPGIYIKVPRLSAIHAEWMDNRGQTFTGRLSGLLAQVVQHEVEHLDGKDMLTHLSQFDRDRIINRINRLRRKAGR